MPDHVRSTIFLVQFLAQRLAMALFVLAALALVMASGLAAFGIWPWLDMPLAFGGTIYPQAGIAVQSGITLMMVLLCFYLPANARIMALENSHRRFHMGMDDVARAYAAAHAADRAGMFRLQSEFDAIRERLAYMREHPDLDTLEPQVMEVAAQMSYLSRELAEIYSDDRVDRARAFLKQRQQEIDLFNRRIDHAKAVTLRLKQWAQDVDLEESVAVSQLERLREDLRDILPELGYREVAGIDGSVISLTRPTKAAE